jgi:GNAT superfamily N-acetyltransferase
MGLITSDLTLSRRLENAEGRGCIECVEARAAVSPEAGARWIEVAGACAMYDGPESPMTQTFGLGIHQPVASEELDAIEKFYFDLDAPVHHEVSPLADASAFALLNERNYRPIEFTSVLYRSLEEAVALAGGGNERVCVRIIEPDERELWVQTAAEGWSEVTEFAGLILDLMRIVAAREGALSFLAEIDGRAIAAGAMFIHGGVAVLAGASTIPAARRQGAQLALLAARLRYARASGCDLAMMCAAPGSSSQRNAERQGFRIAYTRTKWRLDPRAAVRV